MSKGNTKFELILLFDRLGLEPKKMSDFLISRGQQYTYDTLKDYYGYYHIAKNITNSIMVKK